MGNLHSQGQIVDSVPLQHLQDGLTPSHQNNLHSILLSRGQSSSDRSLRRVISSHCVYNDSHVISFFLFAS